MKEGKWVPLPLGVYNGDLAGKSGIGFIDWWKEYSRVPWISPCEGSYAVNKLAGEGLGREQYEEGAIVGLPPYKCNIGWFRNLCGRWKSPAGGGDHGEYWPVQSPVLPNFKSASLSYGCEEADTLFGIFDQGRSEFLKKNIPWYLENFYDKIPPLYSQQELYDIFAFGKLPKFMNNLKEELIEKYVKPGLEDERAFDYEEVFLLRWQSILARNWGITEYFTRPWTKLPEEGIIADMQKYYGMTEENFRTKYLFREGMGKLNYLLSWKLQQWEESQVDKYLLYPSVSEALKLPEINFDLPYRGKDLLKYYFEYLVPNMYERRFIDEDEDEDEDEDSAGKYFLASAEVKEYEMNACISKEKEELALFLKRKSRLVETRNQAYDEFARNFKITYKEVLDHIIKDPVNKGIEEELEWFIKKGIYLFDTSMYPFSEPAITMLCTDFWNDSRAFSDDNCFLLKEIEEKILRHLEKKLLPYIK